MSRCPCLTIHSDRLLWSKDETTRQFSYRSELFLDYSNLYWEKSKHRFDNSRILRNSIAARHELWIFTHASEATWVGFMLASIKFNTDPTLARNHFRRIFHKTLLGTDPKEYYTLESEPKRFQIAGPNGCGSRRPQWKWKPTAPILTLLRIPSHLC